MNKWSKHAMLLDDDDLIRRTWALSARMFGVSLQVFHDPSEFLAALRHCKEDTDLFIDSRLRNGMKGETVARKAVELGFRQIFMASGLPATYFSFPGLSGVVGKDPPWSSREIEGETD